MRVDEAIKEPKEDRLDRAPLAERLAESVLKAGQGASLVVGVTGTWGTGKSSFLNLLRSCLEEKQKAYEVEGKKLALLEFQPWHYANQDQLIDQFFRAFRAGVLKQGTGESSKKIATLLEALSVAVKPLGEFHPLVKLAISGIKGLSKAIGAQEPQSVEAAKKGIASVIQDNKLKLVIFIDELDRLNFTEINQMFQLVKSLADFPNTVYVLGFDREVIEQALESSQKGFGRGYLDKIIQMPFPLPVLSRVQIDKFLRAGLKDAFKNHQIELEQLWTQEQEDRYRSLQLDQLFTTLRGPLKLVNRLDFALGALKEEVDLVDLIGILALEILAPEVHGKIQGRPDLFWEPARGDFKNLISRGNGIDGSDKGYKTALETPLGENWGEKPFFPIVTTLFPCVEGHISDSYNRRKEAIQNNRINSPEHFNSYFSLSLTPGQLTRSHVFRILGDGKDWQGMAERMVNLVELDRVPDFPNFLLDFVNQIPLESVEPLLKALFEASKTLQPTNFSEGWTDTYLHQLIYWLLVKDNGQQSRSSLLMQSIENPKTELSLLIALTREFALDQGEGRSIKKDPADWVIDPPSLAKLKKISMDRILQLARSGELPTMPGSEVLIWSWEHWGDLEELQTYCSEWINQDKGLCLIAECSLGDLILSPTSGRLFRQLKAEMVKYFVSPEIFLGKAQAYLRTHEPTALYYDKFKDYVERETQLPPTPPQNTPPA